MDPKKCVHKETYVAAIKSYVPAPDSTRRVFAVEVICKACGARLRGQLEQQ